MYESVGTYRNLFLSKKRRYLVYDSVNFRNFAAVNDSADVV